MGWDGDRAKSRILDLKEKARDITVQSFADEYYPLHKDRRALNEIEGKWDLPIFKLPYNKAILTDGVHVYAKLLNFDSFFNDHEGEETEISHRRMLQFLHLHYIACDRLVRLFQIQRVDYHSGRMHAVVLSPTGPENEGARIEKAIKFSAALRQLSKLVSETASVKGLNAFIRVGVDSGEAVAINGGRGPESDPLFLGNAANVAAKLADGNQGGVYLSDHIKSKLVGIQTIQSFDTVLTEANESFVLDSKLHPTDVSLLSQQLNEVSKSLSKSDYLLDSLDESKSFIFHQHTPPLKTLKFKELMPSNSIRMPIVSIFADLSGFTEYVKHSISQGRIEEMVSNIHVLRGELTNVLRDDYSGKKIRYIGDCLHGESITGKPNDVDIQGSITNSVLCSAAIRSSFNLCKNLLELGDLDISIGIEIGYTPITRLGLNGDKSVRCSSSSSVSSAEFEQQRCGAGETAIGQSAYISATSNVQSIFKNDRIIRQLDFANALQLVGSPTNIISSSNNKKPIRSHFGK